MTVKSGQVWSGLVVTKGATGALAAPSAGPAGVLYVDGIANAASVTISGSNPYKWTVTLPTLTAGQCVSMYITATIATIATASVVAEDVADTVRLSDVPAVNVTHRAGVAVATADANGNDPVVLYGTQGAVSFGQVKITADKESEGALHIENVNSQGWGFAALAQGANGYGLIAIGGESHVVPQWASREDLYRYLALVIRNEAGLAADLAAYLAELNINYGSGAGTYDNTTDSLQAIAANVATIDNSGTYSYSDTVDDGSGNLLDGVYIQCATDSGFTNIVTTTHTSALGAFTVRSDTAGTHYLRLQLAGYSFTDQTVTLA